MIDENEEEKYRDGLARKRYIPASELMSDAMLAQIDRIVEQQRERERKKIHEDQRGLEQWI